MEEKMRIHELMYYIKTYFLLGVLGLITLTIIGAIGYFIIYKKTLKGKKRLSKKQAAVGSLFIIYIIMVLGVTFLSRGSHFKGSLNLRLFSSYKEAWNEFSFRAWQYIILNIFMFMPFGFLLPLLHERFQRFHYTLIGTLLFTAFIEVSQLITGAGIFELDDIFNNTLGGIIGYGIIMAIILVFRPSRKKVLNIVGFLSPLVITVAAFIVMFVYYNNKEFGNLTAQYVFKINLKNTNLILNTPLEESIINYSVYKAPTYTKEEALVQVKDLFKHMDIDAPNIEIDAYSNDALYWRRGEASYSIWFYNIGGRYNFTDFSSFDDGVNPADTDEATLLDILRDFGINIPSEADFNREQIGSYQWRIDKYVEGNNLINGAITCTYFSDNTIKELNNYLIIYEKIRDVSVKSEKEAYEELVAGKFHYYYGDNISEIIIEDVSIDYQMDSKGFYQPVYSFKSIIDGNEQSITIPAIK